MPKLPTGLVRKRGRPGYYARDQRGSSDRLVKLSNDRTVAIAKLRELRGDVPAGPITVKDAALAWLGGAVATRRGPKFQKLTRQRANDYLIPLYGYRRLASLTAEHCREYRLRLENHELSGQSVAHILADLRCMLLWAVESSLIVRSPFPRRLLPRLQEQPPRRLSAEEVARCIALDGADGFECRILFGTGIRWREARQALTSHVEDGSLVIANTKSFRVRRVPLAPALEREIVVRVGRIFRFENAQTLAIRVRRSVPGFSAHRARHTFAYQYLERGGSLHALRELMGHSTVKVTEGYLRGLGDLAEREARAIVGR